MNSILLVFSRYFSRKSSLAFERFNVETCKGDVVEFVFFVDSRPKSEYIRWIVRSNSVSPTSHHPLPQMFAQQCDVTPMRIKTVRHGPYAFAVLQPFRLPRSGGDHVQTDPCVCAMGVKTCTHYLCIYVFNPIGRVKRVEKNLHMH